MSAPIFTSTPESRSVSGAFVTVTVTGQQRLQRALKAATPAQSSKWVREYLTIGMLRILDNAARKQIKRGGAIASSGPRGGRVISAAPPLPNKLTSRTGTLRRSLGPSFGLDKSGLPKYIDGGTELKYGKVHEFGLTIQRRSSRGKAFTAKYPKRAFLAPALRAVTPSLPQLGIDLWEKQIREAAR